MFKRPWFIDESVIKIPWFRHAKLSKCLVVREKLFLFYEPSQGNMFEISLHRFSSRYHVGYHYWSGAFRLFSYGIWWRTEPVWPTVMEGC